jgi:hypothetical protein
MCTPQGELPTAISLTTLSFTVSMTVTLFERPFAT